jgi:hypothetical protein
MLRPDRSGDHPQTPNYDLPNHDLRSKTVSDSRSVGKSTPGSESVDQKRHDDLRRNLKSGGNLRNFMREQRLVRGV